MTPTDRDPNSTADVKPLTLVELLRWRALHQSEQPIYTFLVDGETEEIQHTCQDLDRQARAVGAELQSFETRGERALLLYPPGLDYINAFFGCLYAGVVAVPAYPPDPGRLNRTLPRLQAIVADAQATLVLTTAPILSMVELLFDLAPDLKALRWVATDTLANGLAAEWCDPRVSGDSLAFLQYTSGSTAAPRGVMLTHNNLLHNSALIHECFEVTPHSRGVIWLPPYHDMGLIGGILQPLYGGFPVILLSPLDFLKRPLRWLQAISRYQATISGGPSFAYDLCVRKVSAQERATLDLSSWALVFNGAEPVRHETLEQFAQTFAPCGFRKEAFYPCYGLAEATLLVSGGDKAAAPMTHSINRVALQHNQIESVAAAHPEAQTLVGCGHALVNQHIVIADPDTLRRCGPDQVGEIWTSGPSVAQGYWNQPGKTAETFQAHLADTGEGPFLRTGDLGFLQAGELFVTGRLKDLIIIRGHNHYPQDIEFTAEKSHPVLRSGCCAAFAVPAAGEERLVVMLEVGHQAAGQDLNAAVQAIRQAVAEKHAVQVYGVVLLRAGSIPKTSSGKIRRQACREGFLADSLDVAAKHVLDVVTPAPSPQQPEAEFIRKALRAVSEPTARQTLLMLYLREQAARVLRVAAAQVNMQQSLSTLGLDSLMAVELKHAVETGLGVVLPMVDFIQGPSIAQRIPHILAEFDSPSAVWPAPFAPTPEPVTKSPLSHGQRAMWFLHRLSPTSAAYNLASAVHIEGELEVSALRHAFQALIERHPSLRTTFPILRGEPVQHVHGQAEVYFQVEDAATWRDAALNERLVTEAHRPFDLERGPLLRVHLFHCSTLESILLLVVHHSVADFWSLAVLVRELGILYPAKKTGAAVSLPTLSLRYSDYAHWQANLLAGAEGERLWAYWREQLAGELRVLNLPTDHPRPALQTFHGATQTLNLSLALTGHLKTLGRAHGASLYTTLLAAFQTLLYRYTGQADILIGTPAAGRDAVELAGLIGYFVNPLVLRGDASGNPAFTTFLERIRQTVLGATTHQSYPFSLLVERLQPERDLSRSPIFQVWFVLQQAPLSAMAELAPFTLREAGARMALGDLTLRSVALEQRTAQFDLALAVAETADGLRLSLQYNSDLFEADSVKRMLGHFQAVLAGVVADPGRRLSDLPLLPTAERQQVLEEWNATQVDDDRASCLHQLFEAQARQTPDAPALIFEGRQLTYRVLDRQANQLAHYLQKLGVGPDVLVAICVERSPEMVVGLLAILKAGGAYLPLDPSHPHERLAFILEDAHSPVLLTQHPLRDARPQRNCHVVCLDADGENIARESVEPPDSPVCADNLAYVIYTSGSTGKPKGVQVTQRAVVNFLNAMRERPGLTHNDILLSVTTLSFDIAGLELFLPLAVGAVVELAGHDVMADGRRLAERIADSGATVMQATPATWRLLLETGWQGSARLRALCGGEMLPRDLADRLLERAADVWNMYGPTETTIWSTTCQVKPGTETVSIGRPIANTQVYLLDKHLNLAPIGVAGELYIGGEGLARGYLNRPALTAEKFIPHPFSTDPSTSAQAGARLYHTGDLARYRPDGNLEILGRVDHQVKIRGYRIEPAEIEISLRQHPGVQAAVVLVQGDTPDGKRLVAYVVLDPKQATTIGELRAFLKGRLPEYMTPSVFMTLAALPLTPNGKVDRRALPIPDGHRPTVEAAYVVPQTQLEQSVAEVWQNVLQIEQVGIHDNFFELGGHSLRMATIHSRLQEKGLGHGLSMVELFQYPTVHSLAKYLGGKESLELNHERVEVRSARQSAMQQQKERRRTLRSLK